MINDWAAPANHRLSRALLADLATGGGSPQTVQFLADTQYSRRLLLLLAVRDMGTALLGPLPPIDEAWAVMDRAKADDPENFRSALMHPQIGNWAAYAIRQQHARSGTDPAPAWVDFGQIHAVALVVAARCGQSWRTRIPLRRGRATLPGLGQAAFETHRPWDSVTAMTSGGRIRLTHDARTVAVPDDPRRDDDGWHGLRRLTTGAKPTLELVLDDLDPFRNLADPVEPERLTANEVAHWQTMLDQAWTLLSETDPPTAQAIVCGVRSFAPLARADQDDDEEIRSASTAEAFGAVVLSSPTNPVDLAATLVHEYQHIKLGGLMHLCPLHRQEGRAELYAPWRDDPRPLGGLVQGVFAFHGIAAFYRKHTRVTEGPERRVAQFAYALSRAQTATGLEVARRSGGLTEVGEQFFAGLAAAMRPWFDDRIPDDVSRLVALALHAHRSTWLLHHRRPAPQAIAALVRCWSAGEPADQSDTDAAVIQAPTEAPQVSRTWSRPLRAAVIEPTVADTPVGALIAGDAAAAKAEFLTGITTDPDDLVSWTGLGLSCGELGERAAATALTTRPDLVRAVYLALRAQGRAPQADQLAAWSCPGFPR
ncbi:HEXXH motif domain-containing protein [Actinoplanes sp. L3-i22]|uniref:HEXXH motif domain-containing protein n=1 Tax=Actinoplanes sp. L3-i22 TaxID=2836373 RepID=UPI001C75BBF6|nr:HEXXH motif domain-containing protein [Actinoplanes sp. L3-i22]BCY08904.1 HEXXH motif domain-containing protein [Actinoplanes sp. L3-i22]